MSDTRHVRNFCLLRTYQLCVLGFLARLTNKICWARTRLLILVGPQSRFGDKLLEIWVVCPQNRTAVLKGLILYQVPGSIYLQFIVCSDHIKCRATSCTCTRVGIIVTLGQSRKVYDWLCIGHVVTVVSWHFYLCRHTFFLAGAGILHFAAAMWR